MAIRPESRWWIATLVLMGLLLGLAALALNRPDVAWSAGQPVCPQCRGQVAPGSRRCPACREEFDWVVAPDEESTLSRWSLSALEEQHLRARVKALTEPVAVERASAALGSTPAAAREYLRSVGSGRCGWCGGTGKDPERAGAALGEVPAPAATCPACQGRKACVACAGDRRIRLGDQEARRALARYQERRSDLSPYLGAEQRRAELARLAAEFLDRNAGTEEATQIEFAPFHGVAERAFTSIVEACRSRLIALLEALTKA